MDHRRRLVPRAATVILATALAATGVSAEFYMGLGGVLGRYLLPDEIEGNITGSASRSEYNSAYAEDLRGTPQAGYRQTYFSYSHPFHKDTRNNLGFAAEIGYYLPSNVGFGLELMRTFSMGEYAVTHTVLDTLPQDVYSSIPHDLQVRSAESDDRLFIKTIMVGASWRYRKPLTAKLDIALRVGMGLSLLTQLFQIEQTDIRTSYRQSSGNTVYSVSEPSSFDAFGIQYTAVYLRPGVGLAYHFTRRAALDVEITAPFSYIEKGHPWTEGSQPAWTNSATYYPNGRFAAGDLAVTLGISARLGRPKGGQQ